MSLQVREEQKRLRPDINAPITGDVLNEMVYTRQVVKEVLRFRPPAPMVPQVSYPAHLALLPPPPHGEPHAPHPQPPSAWLDHVPHVDKLPPQMLSSALLRPCLGSSCPISVAHSLFRHAAVTALEGSLSSSVYADMLS